MAETIEELERRLEVAEGLLADLAWRAYKYDDKPHQLFSALCTVAKTYTEDERHREEAVRLMAGAYCAPRRVAELKHLGKFKLGGDYTYEGMGSNLLDNPATELT